MKRIVKIILIFSTVNLNAVLGREQARLPDGLILRNSGYSNSALKFGSRLWVKLQLCQSQTCTKCAMIVVEDGKNRMKGICQRLLKYKNCCSRTTLLARGFK